MSFIMLRAIGRGHVVARTLRTCLSHSNKCQTVRKPVEWLQPSLRMIPAATRSFYLSPSWNQVQAVGVVQQQNAEPRSDERITQFAELASKGLVSNKIISSITNKMGLSSMTDIQSLTIHETLKGNDV